MCEQLKKWKFRKHTVTTIHGSVKTFSNLCLKKIEKLFLNKESNLGYYVTLNSDPMFLYTYSFLTRQFKGVFMLLDEPARKNTIMLCTHLTTYISPFILAWLLHATCLWTAEWDEKTKLLTRLLQARRGEWIRILHWFVIYAAANHCSISAWLPASVWMLCLESAINWN